MTKVFNKKQGQIGVGISNKLSPRRFILNFMGILLISNSALVYAQEDQQLDPSRVNYYGILSACRDCIETHSFWIQFEFLIGNLGELLDLDEEQLRIHFALADRNNDRKVSRAELIDHLVWYRADLKRVLRDGPDVGGPLDEGERERIEKLIRALWEARILAWLLLDKDWQIALSEALKMAEMHGLIRREA